MGRDWIIGPGGNIFHFWWVFLPATLAVLLFGITWNIIGDGLSDALNPESKGRLIKEESSEEQQETDSIHRRPVTVPLQARYSMETSLSPHKVTPLEVRNSIILQVARDAVVNRDLSKALEAYGFLVHHSRLPDIVISDLAALARLFPNEPLLWKTLGDALTSVGKCSYADKAYAQAEIVSQKQNRA
jgi:hypothetical protein